MAKHEQEIEYEASRSEVVALLRELADTLEARGGIDVERGGERLTAEVPDRVEVELELERENGEFEFDLELSWEAPEESEEAEQEEDDESASGDGG